MPERIWYVKSFDDTCDMEEWLNQMERCAYADERQVCLASVVSDDRWWLIVAFTIPR